MNCNEESCTAKLLWLLFSDGKTEALGREMVCWGWPCHKNLNWITDFLIIKGHSTPSLFSSHPIPYLSSKTTTILLFPFDSRKRKRLIQGSMLKNPPANVEDAGWIPGSGRSPGGGNGNPLQYSCLVNPMDRGACWATVHGVVKSQTWLSD